MKKENTKTWSNAELRKKCRIEEYDTYGNTTDEGSVPGDGKDNVTPQAPTQ